MSKSHVLATVRTEYVSIEDRLYLSGVTPEDEAVGVWATQRLFRSLIDHLLKSSVIEREHRSTDNQNRVPENKRDTEESHEVMGTDTSLVSILAAAVDVTCHDDLCTLVFRDQSGTLFVRLTMNPPELRAWLRGLLRCFDGAGWNIEKWWLEVNEVYASVPLPATIH